MLWYVCFPLLLAQEDPAKGERIYLTQCSICHGQTGEGGRGSPLAKAKLRHAPDDETLARVARRGIPDTEMPANPLTEEEARLVATHVRKLGRVAPEPVKGDARKGQTLFVSKGCAGCHNNGVGPDLADIGDRRNAAHIRRSMTDPEAEIAAGYFRIRVSTADGRSFAGIRVNEDTFSIQVRDALGKLHSFWKQDLRSLDKQLAKSMMPSYKTSLSEAELDDLAAYLASESRVP